MADLVLLGRRELRHRALVVGTGVVGHERRVVAEATTAPGSLGQPTLAAALEEVLGAVRLDQRQRAVIGRPPVLSRRRDLAQQLGQVLLVARAGASVAGRMDSGTPTEARRLNPR